MYRYAREVGSEHYSTSAKSGLGVNDVFKSLADSTPAFLLMSK
jgi:hypothetical protein